MSSLDDLMKALSPSQQALFEGSSLLITQRLEEQPDGSFIVYDIATGQQCGTWSAPIVYRESKIVFKK